MTYKHYCVIDAQNRYKTLVLVINEPDETGELQEKVQYYTLLEGERLIDAAPPVMRPYICLLYTSDTGCMDDGEKCVVICLGSH